MEICKDHWEKVRQAIADRGMDHLGARGGEQALENIKAELEGEETPFDPYMTVNMMIWNRALQMGGLYLMELREDGSHYCPVCEALLHMEPPEGKTKEDQERFWIDGPVNAALEEAREKGAIPKMS